MPDDQKPVDVWMLTTHLPPGRSLLDIIGVTQRPDETTIEAAERGVADLRRDAIAEADAMTPEVPTEYLGGVLPDEWRGPLANLVRIAIQKEREACAKVAEETDATCDCGEAYRTCSVAGLIAAAIHARGRA